MAKEAAASAIALTRMLKLDSNLKKNVFFRDPDKKCIEWYYSPSNIRISLLSFTLPPFCLLTSMHDFDETVSSP